MERDEARADIRLKARFMSTVSHDAGDQEQRSGSH